MAGWPLQKTFAWTGLPSASGRVTPPGSRAVHGTSGPWGPHHFFGTSASEMGSGSRVSESGQCRLHARPSYEANGMITPSRRSAARVNFCRSAAIAPAAADTARSSAAARRTPVRGSMSPILILLVEDFADLLEKVVA